MKRVFRVMLALSAASALATVTAPPASAATRDIRVHFTNNSDSVLKLDGTDLSHGCWGTEPPATVAIGQTVDIASESCGVATGTEFTAFYKLERTGKRLRLHYSNPFIGSDTFDEEAPDTYLFETGGEIENRTANFGCDSKTCDGIADEWKRNGVTIDPGNNQPKQLVDLPKMGVTLNRPNVMVQLDWMQDNTHNQQLRQAALDTVIGAYDQLPVTYRGATRPGITLIIDAGPNSTITPGGATWGSLSRARQITWTQDFLTGSRDTGYQLANFYTQLRNNLVPTGRLPIFHYAVAAANIAKSDSTSGYAPNGFGMMVTLGSWTGGVGSQNEQTGTFMHEFGHVLGLDHSGGEGNGDNVNYKPNYPSIMSYAYQMRGVFRGGTQVFDYSRTPMPDVDETTLTEAGGVDLGQNPAGYGTTHSCGTKGTDGKISVSTFVQAGVKPVDWDCNGTTPDGATGFDGNGDTVKGTLKGAEKSDWDRLVFKTGGVGAGSNAKDTVTVPSSGVTAPSSELTVQQDQRIRVLPLATTLTYNGAETGDYHDTTTMSATLVTGNEPVPNKTITFRIGSNDSCAATTNAAGTATCSVRITQAPGVYPVTAAFGGDPIYKAANTARTFTVTKEQTVSAYTGDVRLANGTPANLAGKLTEDDGAPIAGAPLTLTVGTGPTQQSCTATTDTSGAAGCTIPSLAQPLTTEATVPLGVAFAGDRFYLPSNASATGKLNYMTGRAFGLSADVNLPLVTLRLPAQPDTGPIRTAAASTTTTPCSASVSTLLISARGLCPNVTVTLAPGKSVGSTSVEETTIGIPGLPVIKATAIRSVSTSTCTAATGSVTISNLTVGGIPVNTDVAPNSGIDLAGGARLTLNEQLPVPGADRGLTVNALHLTGLGGTVDVVLGSSTSDIHNC